MEYQKKARKQISLVIIIGSILVMSIAAIEAYIKDKNEEEVLNNGIKLSALLVDKKELIDYDTDLLPVFIGNTLMVIPTDESERAKYSFKIYAKDKNYDIEVNENFYNSKSIGESINIKLYKDKIVLLEEK
mgnify:CR=1 FL=1